MPKLPKDTRSRTAASVQKADETQFAAENAAISHDIKLRQVIIEIKSQLTYFQDKKRHHRN
jgi:hypothetical protein